MIRETLDETLDRVANEITAVPPDVALVARLRPQLDESVGQPFGWRTLVAATCVLALALAASLVRHNDAGTRRASEAPPALVRPLPLEAERAVDANVARAGHEEQSIGAATAGQAHVRMEHPVVESAIPALPVPPAIDLAHLQLDPLVVDAVNFSRIELADISVTDLGAAGEPKE